MFLREIGVKTLKIIVDSKENDNKKSVISLCEKLFWFVYSKIEAEHEWTQNLFIEKITRITNDISNTNEFYSFKIYFMNEFNVIERWFNCNEEFFDYTIELIYLFIHMNSNQCKETEIKILQNIIRTNLLAMDYSIKNRKMQLIATKILYSIMNGCTDSVLQLVSFDRNECIKLVMHSMKIFEPKGDNSDVINRFNRCCSTLITNTLKYNKSISEEIYAIKLLEIIRECVPYKTIHNNLLEYCFKDISDLNILPLKILEVEKVFDLYFLVLNVSFGIFDLFKISFQHFYLCRRNS
jgi:hypothetical protein